MALKPKVTTIIMVIIAQVKEGVLTQKYLLAMNLTSLLIIKLMNPVFLIFLQDS